jgi:hypothetical protein
MSVPMVLLDYFYRSTPSYLLYVVCGGDSSVDARGEFVRMVDINRRVKSLDG